MSNCLFGSRILTTKIFANGNAAKILTVDLHTTSAEIIDALNLAYRCPTLLLHGGASNLSNEYFQQIFALFQASLAPFIANRKILVVDGGTNTGIPHLLGESLDKVGITAPLIGICPANRVTLNEEADGQGLSTLEPNHTHFVLTSGEHWGDETPTFFALVSQLTKDMPSLAILINGGAIAKQELLRNVQQNREIIVIRHSGRLADVVADVYLGRLQPPDDELATIVEQGRLTIFDGGKNPAALIALLETKMGFSM